METQQSPDQFNLRWSNHTKNFVELFAHYQNQEDLVDVTLSCEGQYVKAHRLILSACSDYFQGIFQVHKMVAHPFILLNGIQFKDLQYILNFIYHGEVKVLESDLPSVLALGASLQIKGLSSVKLRSTEEEQKTMVHSQPQNPTSTTTKVHNNNRVVKKKKPQHNYINSTKAYFPTNTVSQSFPPEPYRILDNSFNNIKSQDSFKIKLPNFIIPNKTNGVKHKGDTNLEKCNTQEEPLKTVPVKSKDEVEPPLKKRLVLAAQKLKSDEKSSIPLSPSPVNLASNENSNSSSFISEDNNASPTNKVSRPPNAFMIFANEWRRKLAIEYPEENNKEISKRLGNLWKTTSSEEKEKYYDAAKKADREHRLKHPNYQHNLNEARKTKTSTTSTSTNGTGDKNLETLGEEEEEPIVLCLSESE